MTIPKSRNESASSRCGAVIPSYLGWCRFVLLPVLFLVGTTLPKTSAQEPHSGDPFAELRNPITVTDVMGRVLTGSVLRVAHRVVHLRVPVGVGEVIYELGFDAIESVNFPGAEIRQHAEDLHRDERWPEVISVLRALLKQRRELFPILPREEPSFFVRLVEAYHLTGAAVEAIAHARLLLPYLKLARDRRYLEDVILVAHYELNLIQEARQLATVWTVARGRYSSSALGWLILAKLALNEGEAEPALVNCLYPIVFSGHLRVPFLFDCYDVAIKASRTLGEEQRARILEEELAFRAIYAPEHREDGLTIPRTE